MYPLDAIKDRLLTQTVYLERRLCKCIERLTSQPMLAQMKHGRWENIRTGCKTIETRPSVEKDWDHCESRAECRGVLQMLADQVEPKQLD